MTEGKQSAPDSKVRTSVELEGSSLFLKACLWEDHVSGDYAKLVR